MTRRLSRVHEFFGRRFGRRAVIALAIAALIGVPGATLRALCVGSSCRQGAKAGAATPFCSLPSSVRIAIERGFYDSRSPDLIAVTGRTPVAGGTAFGDGEMQPLWPSVAGGYGATVPIVFYGQGVDRGGEVPAGTGLDDVAPTIAEMIALRRPHPEVRSGKAISGVATAAPPRLVLEVVWRGIDSRDLRDNPGMWPNFRDMLQEGAGTLEGEVGSLPLDPAAALTTIGTGGQPSQHGITGTLVRNDRGRLVRAWGRGSPVNVIATLADDLDQRLKERPQIGLVGTDPMDRGVVGGEWYVEVDRDSIHLMPEGTPAGAQSRAAKRLLVKGGFGKDRVPDLLAVVQHGTLGRLDAALGGIVEVARRVSRGSAAVVVAATGPARPAPGQEVLSASHLRSQLEAETDERETLIEALAPGGIFLNRSALSRLEVADDDVLRALLQARENEEPIMADAFPAVAITFGRYC
jgi:hypothetical protein